MPASSLERAIIVAAACALGLVVWVTVGEWDRFRGRDDSMETTSPAPATIAVERTSPLATQPAASTPAPQDRLTLTAARGDSWLVVRAGSATGRELYSGILRASRSVSFDGRRFWLSIGAAANIDARFNDLPLREFPIGTANLLVDGARARVTG